MAARTLNERVEILEQKVGDLQLLPARMDALESQILQLRSEMGDGFSAIHKRLAEHDKRFDVIDQRFDETNRHMRVLHEEVLSRISLLQEGRPRRKR
jgi:hypothetical protein